MKVFSAFKGIFKQYKGSICLDLVEPELEGIVLDTVLAKERTYKNFLLFLEDLLFMKIWRSIEEALLGQGS